MGMEAGMGMKLEFLPEHPNVFMSTHHDGRARLFDLRSSGYKILVDHSTHGCARGGNLHADFLLRRLPPLPSVS